MANANAQTYDIDLASSNLNLDKYKLGISNFDGFNYRNSPFISHEIKNLYTEEQNIAFATDAYCIDGDVISLYLKNIFINGEKVHEFSSFVSYYELNDLRNYFKENYNQSFAAPKNIDNMLYFLTYNNQYCYIRRIDYDSLINKQYQSNTVATFALENDITSIEKIDFVIPTPFESFRNRYVLSYTYIKSNECYACALGNWNVSANIELTVGIYDLIVQDDNKSIFIVAKDNNDLPIVYGCFGLRNDITITFHSKSEYDNGRIYVNNIDYVESGFYPLSLQYFIPYKYGFIIRPDKISETGWDRIPNFSDTKIVSFSGKIEIVNSISTVTMEKILCKAGITIDSEDDSKFRFGVIHNGLASIRFDYFCPCIPFAFAGSDKDNCVLSYAYYGGKNPKYSLAQEALVQYVVGASTGIDGHCSEFVNDNCSQMIRLLYTDGMLTGISALYDNTPGDITQYSANYLFEDNIISNLYDVNYNSVIFDTNHNNLFMIVISDRGKLKMDKLQIYDKRYIIARTADYLNCYDIKEKKMTHIADDWNNRFVCYTGDFNLLTGSVAASVGAFFQADYSQNNIIHKFPGRQGNARIVRHMGLSGNDIQIKHWNIPSHCFDEESYLYGLDCFKEVGAETLSPSYIATVPSGRFGKLYSKSEVYPNLDGNLQEPIPIIVDYDDTNIVPMIKMLETTTLLFPIGSLYFALYYLLMVQEDLDVIFSIQSNLYAIYDKKIYLISYNNGIVTVDKVIAKVDKLRFLCSTPIAAFFWSDFNRTLYQFQGDCLLHRGQTLDEVDDILYVDYIESTNDIIICTNKYAIILSENYAFIIDGEFSFFDIDNEYYYFKNHPNYGVTHLLKVAYKPYQNFGKQPIKLSTRLYGLSNNMLSETDCVFIRVFNAENEKSVQTVKVGGFTLTDKKSDLIESEFKIRESDWDSENTYYIRYQPSYQKALGIQIDIESTVPITYIGISNTPDIKMITKL